MPLRRILPRFTMALIVASCFLWAVQSVAAAPQLVSIACDNVNMRSGPGIGYQVLWYLSRGYPLEVLTTRGQWYKVRDFEGDSGWVHRKLIGSTPHVVVKKDRVNIRVRPDTASPVVVQVNRGTLFRSLGSKNGWVKVRHAQGVTGWVARRLVWGR